MTAAEVIANLADIEGLKCDREWRRAFPDESVSLDEWRAAWRARLWPAKPTLAAQSVADDEAE